MENAANSIDSVNQSESPVPQTPPSQTPPVQPTPEPKKRNWWKLGVLALMVLVLGLAGALFISLQNQSTSPSVVSNTIPTSLPSTTNTSPTNETANWKTYTNSVYNYEISYPSEFNVTEDGYKGDAATNQSTGVVIGKPGEGFTLIINYVGMINNPLEMEETSFAGLQARKVVNDDKSQDIYYINIPDTDQYLELYTGENVNKDIVDQILSTFQFTDENQSNNFEWENYSNSSYSLKYPADFQLNTEEGNIIRIIKVGSTQKTGTELYDGISLRFQPRELNDVTPEQYAENQIKQSIENGTGSIVKQPSPITIGSYKGVEYVVDGLGRFQHIILPGDNGMVIHITNSITDPQNLNYQKTVDQILSTFQFIQ